MERTTIYLAEADREAIAIVKQRYGVSTASDAIRLALRLLAFGASRPNPEGKK